MGIFLITERSNNMLTKELDCKFINVKASTAYQRGCRCFRCVSYFEKITRKLGQEKSKLRAIRNQDILNSLRLSCMDCGWNKVPTILEFHHEKNEVDDNYVGKLAGCGSSIERLLKEIAKGCFLCPTCHKLRHYNKDTNRVELYNPELR